MLNIKEKPHGLLLLTAIVFLLALVLPPLAQIDFQDKTIFSVTLIIFVWIIPLLLISFWLLYLLTKKFLYSTTVTWIHVLLTVSATILIVIVMYIGINPTASIDRQELIGNIMQMLFIVFVLGQILFPANVLIGFLQKAKNK